MAWRPSFRRLIGRLLLAGASSLVTLGVIDWRLRASIGACGRTPFRTSPSAALPHELAPGRTTTYKGVEVRINQQGFRGPELTDPPPGSERIILAGDSFTFGNGCPEEGTLAVRLEAELRERGHPAQVINGGVPAYNADNVVALIRERLLPLAPTRVIYVMLYNDVDAAPPKTIVPDDATIDPLGDFPLHSPLLKLLSDRASGLARRTGVSAHGYVETMLDTFHHGGNAALGRALLEMRQLCDAHGVEFRVAVYPYLVAPADNPYRPIEEECVRRCGELAIPCTPLIDAFRADENLSRYWVALLDSHPNGEANAKVARLLADSLVNP